MKKVIIYTTPVCPYCIRAKEMLSSLQVPFEEVDLLGKQALRNGLMEKYHFRTVPMIMIGDEFIGGYDQLVDLHIQGTLFDKLS